MDHMSALDSSEMTYTEAKRSSLGACYFKCALVAEKLLISGCLF